MGIAGFNPNPYQIGGPINFGSPATNYQSAYANALSINQQNYNNILAGYTGLTNSVLGNLQGQGAAEQQQITDQYAQTQGQANQRLISSGLGNTTVASSVNRGVQADRAKAQVQLAGQVSGQYAQYQSMLGQAQLGFMNSVNAPYPNPQQYINPYAGLKMPTAMPLQQPGLGGGYIRSGPAGGGSGFNSNGGGGAYGYMTPTPYQTPAAAKGSNAQDLNFGDQAGGPYAGVGGDLSNLMQYALGQSGGGAGGGMAGDAYLPGALGAGGQNTGQNSVFGGDPSAGLLGQTTYYQTQQQPTVYQYDNSGAAAAAQNYGGDYLGSLLQGANQGSQDQSYYDSGFTGGE